MAFDLYGGVPFGLHDCKVATRTSVGVYVAAVDVMSVQMLSTTLHVMSKDLEGDDAITASASRAISGEVKFRFGGAGLAVLEVLFGITATSSVASPNIVKQLRIPAGTRFPVFGLAGVALSENDPGSFTVYMPSCKVFGDINLIQMNYGEFMIPELTVRCVDDGAWAMINLVQNQTAITTVVIPPANIV